MRQASAPLFSVVIPAFNRAGSIQRCVESVRSQTLGDFEVLVVDDGSSDDTVALVKRIQLKDSRVKLVSLGENRGACAARNVGFDEARGRFVALLDSDDFWLPHKLEASLEQLSGVSGDDWLQYSGLRILTDVGTRRSNHFPVSPEGVAHYLFVRRGAMQTSSIVVPTVLARQVRFLEGLRRLQDWDFYLRLAASGVRFFSHPDVLVVHDVRSAKNRISAVSDIAFLLRWIDERRHLMSERDVAGFLANKVAPEAMISGSRWQAARWLAGGLIHRAVPPRNLAIEVLRLGLPTSAFTLIRRLNAGLIHEA